MQNIISGIIVGIVVIVGIWCIWFENHSTSNEESDSTDNANENNSSDERKS